MHLTLVRYNRNFVALFNKCFLLWHINYCGIRSLILLFIFSKVKPGKQVNIWLLALKLCGVSPKIVDAAKIVILEILEVLTDLAMFIFVLVILQNLEELYAQNNSMIN